MSGKKGCSFVGTHLELLRSKGELEGERRRLAIEIRS